MDEVIDFEDDNMGSCIQALEKIKKQYPNDEIFFANGGDRDDKNIPEMSVKGVNFYFLLEVAIKNSSSWILNKWQYYFEERKWGSFFNLFKPKILKLRN